MQKTEVFPVDLASSKHCTRACACIDIDHLFVHLLKLQKTGEIEKFTVQWLALGDVGVVLRHGHDEGDGEQAADDERELPALVFRLLLALVV